MARWDHGYVTDTVYTSHFHRETTPVWLATAALLLGQQPPDLNQPFRYADLGCGNGLTALTIAATCPHAEVWGFDFNPAHIEFATGLATRAGLRNVHFVEASFSDLSVPPGLPSAGSDFPTAFDFMVTHGVLSWISPENQRHLIDTIGRRLRPGGLAYVSYNVTTGMANMLPVRTLMRLLAETSPDRSDQAVGAILDQLERLRLGGAMFFQHNPGLEKRLNEIRAQDPRYIAHEYLNRDWHPMMFSDVAEAMAEAKCGFIGSATLAENIDATAVPAGVLPLLAEARDQRMRETLRDIASAQGFRRDLYRRGVVPILPAEQQIYLDSLAFGWTGIAAGEQVVFSTGIGTVTGKPDLYKPLLAQLQAGATTVRELRNLPELAQQSPTDLLQALTLLMAGGYAHPLMPGSTAQSSQPTALALNRAIIAVNSGGGDLPRLVVPTMGTALNFDLMETLVAGALLDGVSPDPGTLAEEVLRRLASGGRSMQRGGNPITDREEALRLASNTIAEFLKKRLDLLRRLGILPD
jgi:SAM-dependent methyltransferase